MTTGTEARSARGALWAAPAERADALVWSTRDDELGALGALCAWAARFEAREGRPPAVWTRGLCADLSLSPAELLAQLPVYVTLCDTLLLVASPRSPLSLCTVVVAHVWRTLGNAAESIDVELIAAAERDATVAAFDSFHVMHATANERLPPEVHELEWRVVGERLERCAHLATSLALNAAVRDLLPAVRKAAAAAAQSDTKADANGKSWARGMPWGARRACKSRMRGRARAFLESGAQRPGVTTGLPPGSARPGKAGV
jgi:hypothetical protein